MIYDIYHKTEFTYQGMVTFSHNIARLKPKECVHQQLLKFSIDAEPAAYEMHEYRDLFGNANHHLLIREAHHSLKVTGRSRVRIDVESLGSRIERLHSERLSVEEALRRLSDFHVDDIDAKQFMYKSALVPTSSAAIRKYALESFSPRRNVFEAANELMNRIFREFEFVPEFSDVTTPVRDIFVAKKGVCQDFAHLAIAAIRSVGLPARYVSGYIETLPSKGKEKLFGADASHAWFSVYIPGLGWADFDPTNDMVPAERHIVLGHGRDYADIAPLKGVVRSSGGSHLSVMVDVRRIRPDDSA